jgi:tellurite resistance protein TerC
MQPHITWIVWVGTFALLVGTVALDLLVIARRSDAVTVKGAMRWIVFYVSFALAFAVALLVVLGARPSGEFLASYVTEYSLSADNLFVFMMLIARFAVPAIALDRVLYLGIVLSLVLRGMFIAAGAAAIHAFGWVFYLFGAFLIYTAVRLVIQELNEPEVVIGPEVTENLGLRFLRRVLPTTGGYVGRKYVVRVDGRSQFTPLVLVTAAIGLANLVFALDSIPAVFGLTKSGYIVFTANAFAMMGLRQLYFLINGMLQRVVYLGIGLAVVLSFIGVKLVLEALHGSHVEHLGAMRVPTVGTGLSLAVIVGVLTLTAFASMVKNRWQARHGR